MTLDEIKIRILPILFKHNVVRAGIFGSYALGEADLRSDLDLLVELPIGSSLLDLASLKADLEEDLGISVDLLSYKYIHPRLRSIILEEEVAIL